MLPLKKAALSDDGGLSVSDGTFDMFNSYCTAYTNWYCFQFLGAAMATALPVPSGVFMPIFTIGGYCMFYQLYHILTLNVFGCLSSPGWLDSTGVLLRELLIQ